MGFEKFANRGTFTEKKAEKYYDLLQIKASNQSNRWIYSMQY